MRLSAPRAAHQREGHERFTLDAILHDEAAVLSLVDARDVRAQLWATAEHTAHLSADQARAVETIARSPWLVQPLTAPAGAGRTTSMRALRAARQRCYGRTLVLAPTGKAVDVALREGAGDDGYTIAKALQLLHANTFKLKPSTLVVVDEAAMVGTTDLRELLTTTTAAGVKTVLLGDQHQLAPVKARGGMFAQLCADLPWTQHLSEVWRMRNAEERSASVALRNGGPASVRRAIAWYRTHERLHCGGQITMAADALAAYQADTAAGKDTLLLCDTTEMADALNQRLHHDTISKDAQTITGARGHRIGVGDLILTRQNDGSIPLRNIDEPENENTPVRNGNRWCVTQINPDNNRLAARRLEDNTLAVFDGDYIREHITHGYAVTVHSAQGVTADTTHAVLGEKTTRALAYVAMTRGRHSSTAYLYQRAAEHEYVLRPGDAAHIPHRGTRQHAARLLRAIVAHDEQPMTALGVATANAHETLPASIHSMIDQKATALRRRHSEYQRWRPESAEVDSAAREARSRILGTDLSADYGLEM
ncbi:ATP-dependent DNA helicase [Mycolicibacterium celeriflavum]|uniref:TraA/ATP-dependent exoDNAse/relaxase n=1 Tax=Mycolicibacterium celeriflavum TaxID=1249101 RepID=A0A7I7RB67_MYCCF|nr:AAA family ATPase [Mycolicibacterium celeriflavum]BBY41784.1 hypothetical protein MCEL_00790 [Mycolicibacterium celeriflavum]